MSTSPLPFNRPQASEQPAGLTHLSVTNMTHSLDFYLDLGCEVRSAADGWVQLRCTRTSFVLVPTTTPSLGWQARTTSPRYSESLTPQIRLTTPNLRALRRRLLAAGISAGAITRPTHARAGQMEVTDPDQHRVLIEQRVSRTRPTRQPTAFLTPPVTDLAVTDLAETDLAETDVAEIDGRAPDEQEAAHNGFTTGAGQ